jgi:small subunit ribosomal protein S15
MQEATTEKTTVIQKHRAHESDTGSPEVQIALLTQRIQHLTGHFEGHAKDHQTRRSLLKMVGRRRRLLTYLKGKNFNRFKKIKSELGLR